MVAAIGQPQLLQQLQGSAVPFGFRQTGIQRRYFDIFGRRGIVEQVIALKHETESLAAQGRQLVGIESRHILIQDAVAADISLVETTDQVHQRRLAGTGLADNRHKLAGPDGQGNIVQGSNDAIAIGIEALDVFKFQ